MRDLNECTAEVFRRSEQRIKERGRKRVRVLAVCIPLCLIVVVWSVVGLPAMTPEGGALGSDRTYGEAAGNAPGSFACPYTVAEIQETGPSPAAHGGKVTDPLAVAELFRTVQSLFEEADSNGIGLNQLPEEEASKNGDLTDAPDRSGEYTVIFTAEDGSRAVYRLSGHRLLNVNTDEAIFLSDFQTAGLLAALGISE